jgi:dienelactone hydrolase
MRYTSRHVAEAVAWQEDVRGKLLRLLKIADLVTAKKSISFDPNEISSEKQGKYTVKEVEIRTTPGRRIRIVVTAPNSSEGPWPAVVCLGGHGTNRYSVYSQETISRKESRRDGAYKGFGSLLAERGFVTISTDVSRHKVYEKGRILMGERLWDVMRCVDYLESMPQVDRARIGCAGLSLGGEMTMWLGAMDKRVAAVVSSGFLTTMDQMEKGHCMCWKFEGLRELVDYADIYSLIAPRPLQCQNGLQEPPTGFYVPIARQALEQIRTIYLDLDRPENVALDVHRGGHEIDVPALLYFLEKHLSGRAEQVSPQE